MPLEKFSLAQSRFASANLVPRASSPYKMEKGEEALGTRLYIGVNILPVNHPDNAIGYSTGIPSG